MIAAVNTSSIGITVMFSVFDSSICIASIISIITIIVCSLVSGIIMFELQVVVCLCICSSQSPKGGSENMDPTNPLKVTVKSLKHGLLSE